MRVLVTAGNTQTPIDRVRCLTNIFTGRTGALIAAEAHRRGHAVTLLTSHPETAAGVSGPEVRSYRTFDDLHGLLAELVPAGGFDAIVHSAAVSDYALEGMYAGGFLPLSASERGPGGEVSPEANHPANQGHTHAFRQTSPPSPLSEVERGDRRSATNLPVAGKIRSTHPELWMKFTPTPKLIDFIRTRWYFRGVLVKFKLEVEVTDAELLTIALRSRAQSDADILVANTLDGYEIDAWLVDRSDSAERIVRADLPAALLDRIERVFTGHADSTR